jgi:hypothetical protein
MCAQELRHLLTYYSSLRSRKELNYFMSWYITGLTITGRMWPNMTVSKYARVACWYLWSRCLSSVMISISRTLVSWIWISIGSRMFALVPFCVCCSLQLARLRWSPDMSHQISKRFMCSAVSPELNRPGCLIGNAEEYSYYWEAS